MANKEQLRRLLDKGVEVWNKWREESKEKIDLSGTFIFETDLCGVDFTGADLSHSTFGKVNLSQAVLNESILDNVLFTEVNLMGAGLREASLRKARFYDVNLKAANLYEANLRQASFTNADFSGAHLSLADLTFAELCGAKISNAFVNDAKICRANLDGVDLTGSVLWKANLYQTGLVDANLSDAHLEGANFTQTSLIRANLKGANLTEAVLTAANLTDACLVETDLTASILTGANLLHTKINNAIISGSNVYGVNVWDLDGEFKEQKDLIISPKDGPKVTVDNVEVAQFIYLILNNEKIRGAVNTLTSKSVLILGRFTPERKTILDALRNKLREYDLLPIVFDFDRPSDKDFTETIKTLAGISYFVIADVTNPKSSPLELQAIVPDYQIPFVPIIQEGENPFAMMVDLQKKYNWVLPTRSYDSIETLMSALKPGIIDPAVEMRNKLRLVKAQEHPTESLRDYLDKSL